MYLEKKSHFKNPIVPNAHFLYPLITSENRKLFLYFRWWRKVALGENGLKMLLVYGFKILSYSQCCVFVSWLGQLKERIA